MDLVKHYQNLQFEASKEAYKSTCHFLTVDNGIPSPFGSGVLVKLGNSYFVFTAAHVIDGKEEKLCVGIKNNKVITLGGTWSGNLVENDQARQKDSIDIAFLLLCEASTEKLKMNYDFIELSEIEINHEDKHLPNYQIVGFPAKQSKYNSYKKELKSKPFIYNTFIAENDVYAKLNKDRFQNVIVKYDRKKVVNRLNNAKGKGPELYGISGCGLWSIPYPKSIDKTKAEKKLIAIMTDWSIEDRKYLVGTRIDVFTEAIRKKHKLNIPQTKLFKYKEQ